MALRVLNVLFEDRYGGPQKRVIEVGETLASDGVETVLCLPQGHGNAADLAQKAGMEIRRIAFARIPPLRQLPRVFGWILLLPRDIWRFAGLFHYERPSIVHVNGAFFLAPAIATKLVRIPLVWHLNDTILPVKIASVFGALVRLLADQIVVAAEAVAIHYGVAGALHDVIYAPVDTQHYGAGVQFPRARKHSVVSIGLIANWNPIKGIEYFVRAAAVVRERLAGKLEVVFAGARMANHPDYCQRVDALIDELGIRSAIRDYGFVLSVAPILADLDVLVLSSTTEACPMVILEGMAAGVPVVATDVGGVRELLLGEPERPAGIVVPPKDPAALAEAVLELLRHPEKAARMGQNGRQLAEERFSLSICAQRHLRVYERASKR